MSLIPSLALCDMHFLAHRARSVLKETGDMGDDLSNLIAFLILEEIRTQCSSNHVATNQAALFYDSRVSFRKKVYPQYKAHRKTIGEPTQADLDDVEQRRQMHKALDLLREEVLPDVGFKCLRQLGVESDDLIASACKTLANKGVPHPHTILSSDSDLYQCIIQDVVHLYDPNQNLYLDHMTFWAKKGIDPNQWVMVKAICGCKSDNVDGIDGVGEITALKYLIGGLKRTSKKYFSIVSPEGQAIISRNMGLVELPHVKTKSIQISDLLPTYQPDKFYKWCEKLGMKSLLNDRKHLWGLFFEGAFTKSRATNPNAVVNARMGGMAVPYKTG